MPSQPTLCTSSDDGGLVVSLAMQAGVPIETLGTVLRQGARVAQGTGGRLVAASQAADFPAGLTVQVLLLCAVLFACRKGGAILHALGVLLLSAALTLYALGRRVRRRLAAAPRVGAALAAFGASALIALLWPSSLTVWAALLSRWAAVLQPAVSAVAAGGSAAALLHLSLSLYGRVTAAAPLVEVKARRAGALAGDHSRHRLRGKRGLQPTSLPSAVAEVWQLHEDGLLLQAAELLSEIESQIESQIEIESQTDAALVAESGARHRHCLGLGVGLGVALALA